jgi:hypothetical protein
LYVGKNCRPLLSNKSISDYFKLLGINSKDKTSYSYSVPSDLDWQVFNWHCLWQPTSLQEALEKFKNKDYPRINALKVCLTDAMNWVVWQEAKKVFYVVNAKTGELIAKKYDSSPSVGGNHWFRTGQTDMDNYQAAIDEYGAHRDRVSAERAKIQEAKIMAMHREERGWYVVELPCSKDDYKRGGHKEHWTNWKVLANSPMHAYNMAVEAAQREGYYWFRDADKCHIEFYGVWTDEKEQMLVEEGLIPAEAE